MSYETNVMNKTTICRTTWLRTDRPVIPTHTADWHHLSAVENALHEGLFALADAKRPEFYEIEIEDSWYYIHIPSRIGGVYLIAAARKPCASSTVEYDTADEALLAS